MIYRSIFFGFALLFTLLGIGVMLATGSLHSVLFNFSLSFVFKGFFSLACGMMALFSFALAISMRAEREAIIYYYLRAKRQSAKIYARKKVKLNVKGLLPFLSKNYRQGAALAHLYHDACDKIHDRKEEAIRLLNRISGSRELDRETKEMLYNQAIAEFNDKLTLIIQTFKSSTLPHFTN